MVWNWLIFCVWSDSRNCLSCLLESRNDCCMNYGNQLHTPGCDSVTQLRLETSQSRLETTTAQAETMVASPVATRDLLVATRDGPCYWTFTIQAQLVWAGHLDICLLFVLGCYWNTCTLPWSIRVSNLRALYEPDLYNNHDRTWLTIYLLPVLFVYLPSKPRWVHTAKAWDSWVGNWVGYVGYGMITRTYAFTRL